MTRALHLSGDPAADALLSEDDFALLTGMLLDQQITMEAAFAGPAKLRDRIGRLEPAEVAGMDPDAFQAVMAEKPAVHRFPGSMAKRVQQLAQAIVDDWGGDTAAIWRQGSPDGPEALRRLQALPGFGEQKARIFLALLGKQCGFEGAGWREAAGAYGEEGAKRSVADIVDADSLAEVRKAKQAAKAAAKAAKG
ncbi:HhH-GPD-type base excision DNA repair protein [Agrococcus terreus]|uniref:(Fe-S)-cluster assembly protein n=1 Tax=Agrococcus terreus TaxID=574649 RepID=A0ABQ2KC33_9MICO|nr:HhH-GPD-type base excision DNA repair protein [Agrococcus terreus]GGN76963.1 (Fe-S)-cluster assembly protein [Agrococcus terreus]